MSRSGSVRVVEVMGTVFSVALRPPYPVPQAIEEIISWWRWVDSTFSPFIRESQVSRLNRRELGHADLNERVHEVITLCRQAQDVTDGYFDAWATGGFDPCGLVKGWSVEIASSMLKAAGSANHCINAGGDVRCAGEPEQGRPWNVGIADPLRAGRLLSVVRARDHAVATSGRAERGDHVLDPHTGLPARTLASVTIVGPDLTWADAYATAAFAMGTDAPVWLADLQSYEALIVLADGTLELTAGFPVARSCSATGAGRMQPGS